MYGLMLIAILVLTGGAIAFIGDRLGSKIGKKKISLFGLRPRDTSTIMTVVTGILITTFTFAVLAATSENVRTALFGMEQLNRTIAENEKKLTNSTKELEDSHKELSRLHKQEDDLKKYARELSDGNAVLEREKEILTLQNSDLSLTNGKLVKDNASLQEKNDALREGLQVIREGEITFRAGEVIASGVVSSAGTKQEIANLLGMLVNLANRNSAQRLGVPEGKGDIWIYQPEYDAAVDAIAQSKQDVVVRIVAAGNLIRGEEVRTNLELFRNHVVYRKNEYIFAHGYQVDNIEREDAERLVMDFLQRVNYTAASNGVLPDPLRGSVGVIEGAQFYEMVESITGLSGKILLSAFAVADTDVLGPLRINFQLQYGEEKK